LKFDIDYASDPDKYDRYNWTGSPGEISRMYNQLAAVREAVGPKIDLCVDMHGRYDFPTAQAIAKKVEPLNLTWLEEPVPAENVDAYRRIAEETNTPISAGENIYLGYGFRRLLEIGGVDIVIQPVPGATIRYQIVVTAAGTGTAVGAALSDAVPASTTYVAGSLTLNGAPLTDAADADAGSFAATPAPGIAVGLGDLTAASAPQTVVFRVTID
jgi:uncharacterized repeat protein (TIGR01451 family)